MFNSFIRLTTISSFFFFNDTATTEIYTLSLHDALPISVGNAAKDACELIMSDWQTHGRVATTTDRKSTRLNSSHLVISYAVFCLKKKKNIKIYPRLTHQFIVDVGHSTDSPHTCSIGVQA